MCYLNETLTKEIEKHKTQINGYGWKKRLYLENPISWSKEPVENV